MPLDRSTEARDDLHVAFLVTESQAVLHHVSEALIRLFLAHADGGDCPWMEVAALRNFSKFKQEVAVLARGSWPGHYEEAIPYVFDLLEHEGLCLGGSSGVNVAGAVRLAETLGPGHTIVTILCDFGTRYQSKLFNPDFLRGRGLPVPDWLERAGTVKPPLV